MYAHCAAMHCRRAPPSTSSGDLPPHLTHTHLADRCFCNPELVLNTQAEGGEAQVTATMLQGACTTQLTAFPPPTTPLKEKLDIKHL